MPPIISTLSGCEKSPGAAGSAPGSMDQQTNFWIKQ